MSEPENDDDSDGRGEDGRFVKGNKIWMNSSPGRKKAFDSPEHLREKCIEYFDWVHDNPLYEAKGFSSGIILNMPKLRYPTISGMSIFIGISRHTWSEYKHKDHPFHDVTEWVDEVIAQMKLEGGAAGLFNQLVVVRDLGLRDKRDVDLQGDVKTEAKSDRELAKAVALQLKLGMEAGDDEDDG